jgi:hypothetical protein
MVTVRVSYTAPKNILEWFNADLREIQLGGGGGCLGSSGSQPATNTSEYNNEILGPFKGGEFWLDKQSLCSSKFNCGIQAQNVESDEYNNELQLDFESCTPYTLYNVPDQVHYFSSTCLVER